LFGREGGFPQGLTSRTEIEVFDPIQPHEEARLRGTLHCRTAGIHFFVVHFNPRNTLKRRLEAAAVIERAGPLIEAGLPVIVLGDFNAVSPADEKALLTKTNLLEKWRMKEREQSSFRVFREDSRLDFTVMQLLLEAGLVDPAQEPKGTFPTRILAPGEPATLHEAMLHRIDYILTAANLTSRNPRTHYPRSPLLDELSDHYPVLLELDRTVPATP
jgi:endonuclease/exonuclease/phosphatase family metal-dependent hydrolase